jgi:hypothetical protein
VSETPVFLAADLAGELVEAAWEIQRAVDTPEYRRLAERAVPAALAVPGESPHTTFLQVDFALVRDESGRVAPRLIELQGFPSLYFFQWLLTRGYQRFFDLPAGWSPYYDGLDEAGYVEVMRRVIVGDRDPAEVVLLEIEPEKQKTRIDFAATERALGVRAVCATRVRRRGRSLFYERDGREMPIRRIYNRVIFDELERKGLRLDDLFRREIDVEWVGHPNWYFKISKFSLPFIRSRYAPPTLFLDGLAALPDDLDNWVLKPIFSFAGLGVEVGPSRERLRSLANPANYVLQRRVEYAPVVATPDDPAKVEIRMMFVWADRPRLVNGLVRMSKGKMMGVDFNKERLWVGSSVAFHPPA